MSQEGAYAIPEKTSIPKGSCESELAGSHGFARNDAGTCEQDWHKSDTADSEIVHGRSEVETHGAFPQLQPEDIRHRMKSARASAEAIGDAHPDDAVLLMSAALTDLSHGGRRPDFFLNAEKEVQWWASCEPPEILVATLSVVLDNLGSRAMHLETRKCLCLVLRRSFTPSMQARFLAHASGGKA